MCLSKKTTYNQIICHYSMWGSRSSSKPLWDRSHQPRTPGCYYHGGENSNHMEQNTLLPVFRLASDTKMVLFCKTFTPPGCEPDQNLHGGVVLAPPRCAAQYGCIRLLVSSLMNELPDLVQTPILSGRESCQLGFVSCR